MGGEEAGQPVLVASLGEFHEGFLQFDGALRVVAGFAHVAHAVLVGFALGVATVLLGQHLGANGRHHHRHLARLLVVDGAAEHHHADHRGRLRDHALGLRAGAVRGVGVDDFVGQHGGELGLGVQLGEQAAVDHDLAARQGPGVGHGVVEYAEFVVQFALSARAFGQPCADAPDVGGEFRVEDELAALRLFQRGVHLRADLSLPVGAVHLEIALAGDRVDLAGRHYGKQQNRQEYSFHPSPRRVSAVEADCRAAQPGRASTGFPFRVSPVILISR